MNAGNHRVGKEKLNERSERNGCKSDFGALRCSTACLDFVWILFVYGVIRFMDDTGIVFRHDGEAFFWFEPQLVELIYGK